MKISIIIPILNEEEAIGKLLWHLETASSPRTIAEILVVDGGSTDRSKAVVATFAQVRFLRTSKGRAKQMNLGAKQAKGAILYFLHADALPPKGFDLDIIAAINRGQKAGCFRMRFDSPHWWLILMAWFTRFNSPICRGGDQSLFIVKNLFDRLGGYDESFSIYEDNNFTQKIYAQHSFVVLPKKITSSARLYRQYGVWRLQYHYFRIHLLSWQGAGPDRLYAYYKKHIAPS